MGRIRGSWTTWVGVDGGIYRDLAECNLTDEAFTRLGEKIKLVHGDGIALVSEDDEGRSYDYGKEGLPEEDG